MQVRPAAPHRAPDVLYHDYGYRSGINATMRRHLGDLAREIETVMTLREGDNVIDIGANDGTLLLAYRTAGLRRIGFEPSNVRPDLADHPILYVPTVFRPAEFHTRFPGRRARVVTTIAMFYDIDDPVEFCRGISDVLTDDGVWVLEMSCLGAMLEHNTFDTICHEHLGYYSLRTLRHAVEAGGFEFYELASNDANGGSVRCYLKKREHGKPIPSANRLRIEQALRDEEEKGYHEHSCYGQFRRNVEQVRRELRQLLDDIRRRGERVYGYGASTKGNVLLQYCGIGPADLIAIADRNPAKMGRLTLGTNIRICSEEEMREARPEFLLVLPWHFLNEFCERERALRATGTRFIVPFDRVHIV